MGTYDSVALPPAHEKPPRFVSILAARNNDTRPSGKFLRRTLQPALSNDIHFTNEHVVCSFHSILLPTALEVSLRAHCQKLRVIEKLSGGAHLLFPGESSLAVRVYYLSDLQALEAAVKTTTRGRLVDILHAKEYDTGMDGLEAFHSAYRTTVVFFVLSGDVLKKQQQNPESFVRKACRVLNRSSQAGKSSLVLTVPDTAAAVAALMDICDANGPTKRGLRREFTQRQRSNIFLPDVSTGLAHSNTDGRAASWAATAFRQWAERFDLPQGEADVLMSVMGSMENIVAGDGGALARAPVEDRTVDILSMFFEIGDAMGSENAELQTRGQQGKGPPMAQLFAQQLPRQQADIYIHSQGRSPNPRHLGNGSVMAGSYQQPTTQSFPHQHLQGSRTPFIGSVSPASMAHAPGTSHRMMNRYM